MFRRNLLVGTALAGVLGCGSVYAACSTTIGSVMSLTGSLGVLGQQIAKGAQLAVTDLNAAGGANGCTVSLS
ncbi:MAG TPA: ABC transporter substrate-binding protein, partial [Burkholderiaceae bacterium]|nr:ABC transporter substrate-binding protein [Burkholderiaceae bacterium]